MEAHGLILAFTHDDPLFALGFEAGRIWEQARNNRDEFTVRTVHSDNAEMWIRIAEATHRTVTSEDIDADWIDVTFSEVPWDQ